MGIEVSNSDSLLVNMSHRVCLVESEKRNEKSGEKILMYQYKTNPGLYMLQGF
jgi:hypothetical protein